MLSKWSKSTSYVLAKSWCGDIIECVNIIESVSKSSEDVTQSIRAYQGIM